MLWNVVTYWGTSSVFGCGLVLLKPPSLQWCPIQNQGETGRYLTWSSPAQPSHHLP